MNNKIELISYKHNGDLHRVWQQAFVVKETNDSMIVINDRVNVVDGDGRRWKTKEPAVSPLHLLFLSFVFSVSKQKLLV